ncbi:MAG: GIY-YIG nuclease family protein [Candidatus Komeilibacteria bacterium]
MKNTWYVYIVQCSDKTLYTGCTNNVAKRILLHNQGLGAKYTKFRRPVRLKYTEKKPNYSAALKREAEIKSLSRKSKLQLIKVWRDAERRKKAPHLGRSASQGVAA